MIEKTLLAINSKEILEFEISIKSVINYCEKNNIEIQLVKDVSFSHFDKLKSRNLIVLSERIKVQAEMIGFTNIRVTLNPSDQAVVDELINEKNKKTSQK